MAERREWHPDEDRTPEERFGGGRSRSVQSEAIPGADRDRDTASNSATSGGAAGEIEDLGDVPEPDDRD